MTARHASTIDPALARTWLMLSGRPEADYAERAAASRADVIVIDIEDSVPGAEKTAARVAVTALLSAGTRAWVRINAADTAYWDDDLTSLAGSPGLCGVVLSKTESADEASETAQRLHGVPLVPLIESARGLLEVERIALVRGVLRLGFGTGDFRRDTGLMNLDHPRSRIAVAAAAAGLAGSIDGGANGEEPESLREQARLARDFGFTAKFALREAQIATLAESLSPSAAEIADAAKQLAAFEAGGGELADGDDGPRLAIARQSIERARAYGLAD